MIPKRRRKTAHATTQQAPAGTASGSAPPSPRVDSFSMRVSTPAQWPMDRRSRWSAHHVDSSSSMSSGCHVFGTGGRWPARTTRFVCSSRS